MNAKRSLLVGLSRSLSEVAGSKKSTKNGVKEVLKKNKAGYGTAQIFRTDPVTLFRSKGVKEKLCAATNKSYRIPKELFRSNRKIERLIKTINQRLEKFKQIVVKPDTSGLSEIFHSEKVPVDRRNFAG